jgi:hypothetical protein
MKPDEIKIIVQNNRYGKKNNKLLSKLLSLPVEQKACLFILFMGILGTVVGGINSEIAIRGCNLQDQCLIVDTTKKRIDNIEKEAYAGMGAAVLLSLPALLRRFGNL